MIHSRYLSLPSSLAEVGRILKIQEQKMTEGKALIKFFCVPYQFDNDEPEFHNPLLYPDKWEIFKAYNKRDVEAELEIDRRLSRYPVPDLCAGGVRCAGRSDDRSGNTGHHLSER